MRGQPTEPPELERCKGWAAGAPGFTLLLPTACVLVLRSLMLAVPPPSSSPCRQVPERRQLAVAQRLCILLTVLPRLLTSDVRRCWGKPGSGGGGAGGGRGRAGAGRGRCGAAPGHCRGRRCRVAAVGLHARLHAELQRLPTSPARPLPLRSVALPRPAVSFGKQYDKNGDYIRHFMPVLKVGWAGVVGRPG